jgi:hypothetical protein
MRRLLMIVPSLALLAACADGPPPTAGIPQPGVTVGFPPGGIVDVIRVNALDREPLRAAELIAPDGSATAASALDVDPNPQRIGGQAAVADPWRISELGTNGINPLPTGPLDPTVRSRNQLMMMVSTADITLSDPVAYRRDWANYKIRLSFAGAGDQLETREIPAPPPPAERTGG